jgi:hypothetical protein
VPETAVAVSPRPVDVPAKDSDRTRGRTRKAPRGDAPRRVRALEVTVRHPFLPVKADPEDDDGKGGNDNGGCGDGDGCGRR